MSEARTSEPLPDGPPPGTRVMAVFRWLLVLVMAAAAVSALFYYRGTFEDEEAAGAETYYCPMHPQVVQDAPGECPICHMTLVRRPHGAAAASPSPSGKPTVELSAERSQLIGLKTAVAHRGTLAAAIRAAGNVVAAEDRLVRVQTRFSGWVQGLQVARTGERVKKGQLLLSVYSPDLVGAQQELINALAWSASPPPAAHVEGHQPASITADLAGDARQRLLLLGLAEDDISTIARTRRPLPTLKVRSPAGGVVSRKDVVEGAYVAPGTDLFEIADLTKVWVLAEAFERDLARVEVGQEATLSLAAYPGETFAGRVDFVYPSVDPARRTAKLRLIFDNPQLRLKPGMYGDVELRAPAVEAVVVPVEALVDTGSEQYVFVASGAGRYEQRRVRAGARAGGELQILEGVAEGELVVTTGNFLLDSESRLRSAADLMPQHGGR